MCGSSLCSPLLCLPSYLLLCRRSGRPPVHRVFFLETSVISAPICAGTLSDENKASLLRFCDPPPLTHLHPHTLRPLASRPPHRMRLRHVACRRSPLTVNQQIARAAPSTLLRAKRCDASCIPSAWFGYLWTTAGKYKYAYVYGFSGDLW